MTLMKLEELPLDKVNKDSFSYYQGLVYDMIGLDMTTIKEATISHKTILHIHSLVGDLGISYARRPIANALGRLL